MLKRAFSEEAKRSYETAEVFAASFDAATVRTTFPETSIGRDLNAVAKTMAICESLGHQRDLLYVQLGGFDNHGELLDTHSDLLSMLEEGLSAFWNALEELGVQDETTLFTCSDFGRTLRSNGRGTDHAWGGHSLVMGGCVDGAKIYGTYPDASELKLGAGLDLMWAPTAASCPPPPVTSTLPNSPSGLAWSRAHLRPSYQTSENCIPTLRISFLLSFCYNVACGFADVRGPSIGEA